MTVSKSARESAVSASHGVLPTQQVKTASNRADTPICEACEQARDEYQQDRDTIQSLSNWFLASEGQHHALIAALRAEVERLKRENSAAPELREALRKVMDEIDWGSDAIDHAYRWDNERMRLAERQARALLRWIDGEG
jgi:hypothetical protein